MTHIPLCTVKGCPTRDKGFKGDAHDWHTPWCQDIPGHKCFGNATHQHWPKKGMGGNNPESKIVACLCAGAHDKIDNSPHWGNAVVDAPEGKVYTIWQVKDRKNLLWRVIEPKSPDEGALTTEPAIIDTQEGDDCQPIDLDALPLDRPVTTTLPFQTKVLPAVKEETKHIDGSRVDLSAAEDEELANLFAWADKQQGRYFLMKCHIIHAYRERHVQAWGQSWVEQAYELFDGAPSRRTLEAYANIWGICDAPGAHLEHIGPLTDSRSLMQLIGRKKPEDGKVAMEAAVAHLAEYGEPPTVAALQHRLGEERKEPDTCPVNLNGRHEYACKHCGKAR